MFITDDLRDFLFPADVRRLERTYSESVIFDTLDNGKLAKIDRQKRWVFFPEGFDPIPGQRYECSVYVTMTGVYTYQNKKYRVCRAHLAGEESRVETYVLQQDPLETESPFATALKDYKAPKYVEKHTVRAEKNPKSGEISLAPIYVDKDPDFCEPTMYFLVTDEVLVEGKEYTISFEKKFSTGRYNRRNALMVRVKVKIW